MFNVFAMIRRFVMTLTILLFGWFPYLQSVIFTWSSLLNLIYVTVSRPYQTELENRVEIIGESVIYLCMQSNMYYSMGYKKPFTDSTIGYYQISLICFMLITNLVFAIQGISINDLQDNFVKKLKNR